MEQFKRAAAQALEHARNHRRGGGRRWRLFSRNDVQGLRRKLKLTQVQFSQRYGFELETVKSWEIGRRFPDQAHSFILALIEHDPNLIGELVERLSTDQQLEQALSMPDPKSDIDLLIPI